MRLNRIEINGFNTNFDYYNSVGLKYSEDKASTDLYGYLDYKMVRGNFVMQSGLRVNYSGLDLFRTFTP